MLTALLKMIGGDISGIVATEFLLKDDLKKARRYVRAHPELLQPDHLARLWDKGHGDRELEDYALGRRALLRLCSEVGVERAFDLWEGDVASGPELLHALINKTAPEEVLSLLEEHPGLADESSVSALGRLAEDPRFASDRAFYSGMLDLLKAVRAIGVEVIRDQLRAGDSTGRASDAGTDPGDVEALTTILLERPLTEFPQWVRRYPDAAQRAELDHRLFHAMRSQNSYEGCLKIGLARGRIARVRRLGVEQALAEQWRPGGMTPEYRAALFRLEDMRADDLDALLRVYSAEPDLLDAEQSWSEQNDFIDPFPAPPVPSGMVPLVAALRRFASSAQTVPQAIAACDSIVEAIRSSPVMPEAETILAWAFYRLAQALGPGAKHDRESAGHLRHLLEEVVDLTDETAPLDRAVALWSLAELAPGLDEQGSFDPATFEERQAWLSNGIALLSSVGIRTAQLRMQLGDLYLDANDPEAAIAELARARAALPDGPDMRTGLRISVKEGEANLAAGKDAEAEETLDRAVAIFDEDMDSSLGPAGTDDTAAQRSRALRLSALAIGRQGRPGQALQRVEQARAQQFLEQMDILSRPADHDDGFEEASRALLRARSSVGINDVKVTETRDPIDYGRAILAHKEKARRAWRARGGARQAIPDIATATGELLSPGEAFISVSTTKYGSFAIIVEPGAGPRFAEIPSFNEAKLHRLLVDTGTPRVSGWLADLPHAAQDFGTARSTLHRTLGELRELVQPLVEMLAPPTRSLRMVLDAKLALLPVHAVELDSGMTLMDRYEVSYAPSAATLVRAALAGRAGKGLCAVGAGPAAKLIYAELEARTIAGLFPDRSVIDGSEDVVSALGSELARREWIHIASHADVDLTNAALRFDETELDLDDFRTGALSVASGATVTLSCCRTGMVDLRADDEKVGFASSLIAAGARGVVTTLWEIDDFPAALLMTRFYRGVAGHGSDARTALRAAQCWLRSLQCTQIAELAGEWAADDGAPFASERKTEARQWADQAARTPAARPFADPFHWAPYTYSGY